MKTMTLSVLLLVASAATAGEPAASPYAPLAFLAGHCWQGELPRGRGLDTHCFSYIYGPHFVRDRHTVHGEGHADYLGESIYFWDGAAGKLQYVYVESDGGSSVGAVEAAADALVFPETTFQQDGKTAAYRSRWQKSGSNAYDVVTEFKGKDGWVPGWTVRMVQTAATP